MRHSSIYILLVTMFVISSISRTIAEEDKYQVVNGDSLLRIAQKFGIPFREIMAANNLKNTTIYTGQILKIPTMEDPDEPDPVPVLVTPEYRESAEPEVYVRPTGTIELPTRGDNAAPIGTAESNTYIVQQGDNLRSISRKLGMKPSDLRRFNHLGLTRIYAGQILRIPDENR